jgi:hypothetical protein
MSTPQCWPLDPVVSPTLDGRPLALVLSTSPSVAGAIFVREAFLYRRRLNAAQRSRTRIAERARSPGTSENRCATVEKIMHPMDEEMRRCVDDCLACHRVCLTTLSQHCLDVGGKHVEPRHTRLMLACAEICRTSAFFMELGTEFHKRTCAVCAEVCAECAKSCEGFDDMQECAEACRRCAESCRRMAA